MIFKVCELLVGIGKMVEVKGWKIWWDVCYIGGVLNWYMLVLMFLFIVLLDIFEMNK